MRHDNTCVDRRRHPNFKAEDFDVITERISLSSIGANCQLNRHISLMTNLKIVLVLPNDDQEKEFEYVECDGVVVGAEEVLSEENVDSVYNIAIYFNEIEESEKAKIANFFESH